MWLLDTNTFELCSGLHEMFKNQGYAILSLRWVGAEITFDQISHYSSELRRAGETSLTSPQLDKIRGACSVARKLGFAWIWIDNCCINKASTTEESESINSMFKWYRDAQVCITYLSDVEMKSPPLPPRCNPASNVPPKWKADHNTFHSLDGRTPSEWFSRGWTLQELLAPRDMRFYDMNWNYMGTKISLAHEIRAITGIDAQYLTGVRNFRKACIATKMSWMAGRTTTQQEDVAYAMLGLFNTMMLPQYGEGMRAFMRLQQQLLSTKTDESLFAWRMPTPTAGEIYGMEHSAEASWLSDEWGMLAPSPDWFGNCENMTIEDEPEIARQSQAFEQSSQGVRILISPVAGSAGYQAAWVASQFTIVGALPTYYYLQWHQKKKMMKGVMMALNCWVRDETGKLAAVSICMQLTSKEHLKGDRVNMMKVKRIRASEMLLSYKYPRIEIVIGNGVVLQPELTYSD